MKPVAEVAKRLNLGREHLIPFGEDKAKIRLEAIGEERPGKLVLVTAMSPSPAGEGKTTTSIGLTDALNLIGKKAAVALREPSMGPVFGMKGGGTGGGQAQLTPADEINLHFTGDFHAVSSAHNLLAAALDNHIHHGNALGFDPRQIAWERVMDCNDRSLRQIVVGLGGKLGGVPRESRFDITAASELTAILALVTDAEDLRQRLGRVVLGKSLEGELIRASELKAEGSLLVLLKHALLPNLVQTLEGNPALVHAGPFANIAHGTSSVLGTWAGLNRADIVVQEAGFGADLGAEKFLHIFCPAAKVAPSAVVLVATIRAMRFHGGVAKNQIAEVNPDAVEKGLANPLGHLKNLQKFGLPVVVAINQRHDDSPEEVRLALDRFQKEGIAACTHSCFAEGGEGGRELAERVVELLQRSNGSGLHAVYGADDPLATKVEKIASEIYGARSVLLGKKASRQLAEMEEQGFRDSRICMAKTPYSFSDDGALVGRPTGFDVEIRECRLAAGAGFVIPISGDIMTMPGLAKKPNLERIHLDASGQPVLF